VPGQDRQSSQKVIITSRSVTGRSFDRVTESALQEPAEQVTTASWAESGNQQRLRPGTLAAAPTGATGHFVRDNVRYDYAPDVHDDYAPDAVTIIRELRYRQSTGHINGFIRAFLGDSDRVVPRSITSHFR